MEDGRGKSRQVVLSSTELLGFPGMGESLGGQLGVAEHVFQGGVIKGTVSGGVESVLSGGGGGLANGGGWDGARGGGGGSRGPTGGAGGG